MSFNDVDTGVDFDFAALEAHIQDRGTKVTHEIGVTCPCLVFSTEEGAVGSAKPGCDKCYGAGYLFRDARPLTAILENATFTRSYMELGWIKPGDLTMSPSIHARPVTDLDKVTISLPISNDSQIIVRGAVSSFTPRPSALAANEDYLNWEAGESDAIWLEDANGKAYYPTDYTLNGRVITWTPGASPAVGVQYVIKYMAFPEYIAWTTPIENWDRQRSLGQRVMLRKYTAISNNGKITPPWRERLDDNAFESDTPYRRESSRSSPLDSQR